MYEDGAVMRRDVTCSYTSSDYVEVIGIEPDELVVYAPEGISKTGSPYCWKRIGGYGNRQYMHGFPQSLPP